MKSLRFESEVKKNGQNIPKLIWAKNSEGANEYCLFRKSFMCDKMPKSAVLSIFVQSKYRLFINGESVLRGNAGISESGEMTDINVLPYIKQGKNVIAIFACFYSYPVFDVELRQKGVSFCLSLDYSGARQEVIYSDETVKSTVCNAYLKDDLRFEEIGCVEVFDSNQFDEDWTLVDFEDSYWDDSVAQNMDNTMYFDIGKSDYKAESEHIHSAKAIIAAGTGNDIKGASLKQSIYNEIPKISLNKLYVAGCECELQPIDKGQYSYIVVDFGKTRNGYIKMDVTGYGEDIIDVIFVKDIVGNIPVVSGAARFILKAENNILETNFEKHEFKYAVLVFRNPVRTNNVNGIWAIEKEYTFENVSEFTCGNEEINSLFKQADKKLKVAFSNQIQGDSLYEKRILALSAVYLTGETKHFKNMLKDIASMQVESGKFINKREQKCLDFYDVCYFALSIKDYYVLTGDVKTTSKLFKTAVDAFKWLSAYEAEGLLLPALVKENLKSDILLNALYICANDVLSSLSLACKDLLAYKHYKLKTAKLKKLYKERFLQDKDEFKAGCKENLGDVVSLLLLADMQDVMQFVTDEENLKFTMQLELIRAMKKSKNIKDLFSDRICEFIDFSAVPVYVAENVLCITYAKKEYKVLPDTDKFGEIIAKFYLPLGVVEVNKAPETEQVDEVKEETVISEPIEEKAEEENQQD